MHKRRCLHLHRMLLVFVQNHGTNALSNVNEHNLPPCTNIWAQAAPNQANKPLASF